MRNTWVSLIAVLAIALAAGCSRKPDDAALVTNIKSAMFSDAELKDASLDVTSQNGEVTLTGSVPNDAAHLEAYKIASSTPGVAKVNDQITVEQAPPAETQAAPAPAPAHKRERSRKVHEARVKKHIREEEPVETAENTPPEEPAPMEQPPAPAQGAQISPSQVEQLTPIPPPPQPRQVTIPAGSTMTIRMIDSVDSSVNQPGEIFHASLEAPLVVEDDVAVPRGADIYVRLVSSSSAGKFAGKSESASGTHQTGISRAVLPAGKQHVYPLGKFAGQEHG